MVSSLEHNSILSAKGPVELNNIAGTSASTSVLFNDNEAYGEK